MKIKIKELIYKVILRIKLVNPSNNVWKVKACLIGVNYFN